MDTEEQPVQKYYWIELRTCIPVEFKACLLRILTASNSLSLQCATFVPLEYGVKLSGMWSFMTYNYKIDAGVSIGANF